MQNLDVLVRPRLQDVVHLDVQQNLDEVRRDVEHLDVQQNLDVEHLDVEHLDAQRPLVVVVDAELRHRLRMDYFLDEEDVELLLLQRMDCYQDVVQLVHPVLVVLQQLVLLELAAHQVSLCMQRLQLTLPALLHVMP